MSNNPMIAIVDYEIGNLYSVQNGLKYIGLDSIITSDKKIIKNADALILPGVGAFGDAMKNMHSLGLIKPIKEFVETGKPFMGICLGLQLLFSRSEEFGNHEGLGIIKGRVVKFHSKNNGISSFKVPQISWNQIYSKEVRWKDTEIDGIKNGEFMYFVHSYYVVPENVAEVLSVTNYEGIEYCSSIKKDNVFASQFHPEKSGLEGIKILSNFKKIIIQFKEKDKCL